MKKLLLTLTLLALSSTTFAGRLTVADEAYIDKTAKHLSGGRVVKTEFSNLSNTLNVYRTLNLSTTLKTMNMFAETWCNDFKKYNFAKVKVHYVKRRGLTDNTARSITSVPEGVVYYVQDFTGQAKCNN